MIKTDDLLIEIQTEELPPKSLMALSQALHQHITERLQKQGFTFADSQAFATPRRLAVLVKKLIEKQPDRLIERKGPALAAAFDATGKPTPACIGFAKSCGVTPDQLIKIKNDQGEWVAFKQMAEGQTVQSTLPALLEQSLLSLPIAKRMRWGNNTVEFVRPVHSVILLYGDQVIPAAILNCATGRVTRGHRFHGDTVISIPHASAYESLLATEGHVIADFAKRRNMIVEWINHRQEKGRVLADSALLDEVTGLVEYPHPLQGSFDAEYLTVPKEALISAMQDHQRYFPVVDDNERLLPYFITVSNIMSQDAARVIHGNERVLRARLSDAAFFYQTDKKIPLYDRLDALSGIVYQAKLGTLYEKVERISRLAGLIAEKWQANVDHALRAGLLSKADLTTSMVGEFPELQGVMGEYYARHDGEPEEVATALREQYLPRFAGDVLPQQRVGAALAFADRLDTLVGAFGINQIPTGDKDPYGLRRAALGCLRILIEKNLSLNLSEALSFAYTNYQQPLDNKATPVQVLNFIQERLRAYCLEQGIAADIFAAVAAIGINDPLDALRRIKAVQAFKKLAEAEALSIANKRVSNILAKYDESISATRIDATRFEHDAERALAAALTGKTTAIAKLAADAQYDQVLLQLADLRKPVDDFFDQVMVMADDKAQRENRILLLSQLRSLFLQVADIALLQS
jgi:glycyl-tRNA synthetase beta chain